MVLFLGRSQDEKSISNTAVDVCGMLQTMNLILVVIGVVVGVSAAAYGARKPRARGEPFDTRRKISLATTLLGLLLVLWGAVLTITGA